MKKNVRAKVQKKRKGKAFGQNLKEDKESIVKGQKERTA